MLKDTKRVRIKDLKVGDEVMINNRLPFSGNFIDSIEITKKGKYMVYRNGWGIPKLRNNIFHGGMQPDRWVTILVEVDPESVITHEI